MSLTPARAIQICRTIQDLEWVAGPSLRTSGGETIKGDPWEERDVLGAPTIVLDFSSGVVEAWAYSRDAKGSKVRLQDLDDDIRDEAGLAVWLSRVLSRIWGLGWADWTSGDQFFRHNARLGPLVLSTELATSAEGDSESVWSIESDPDRRWSSTQLTPGRVLAKGRASSIQAAKMAAQRRGVEVLGLRWRLDDA